METIRLTAVEFNEIRRRFNPAYSYLVFKNDKGSGRREDFEDILTILSHHNQAVVRQIHGREKKSGKLLLVAELDPNLAEVVKKQILDSTFSKGITVYFYRRNLWNNVHQEERCHSPV